MSKFKPCLYFHAFELSIKSVISHFTCRPVCHDLHWVIHLNSSRPQPYKTAAPLCFRQVALVQCTMNVHTSPLIQSNYLLAAWYINQVISFEKIFIKSFIFLPTSLGSPKYFNFQPMLRKLPIYQGHLCHMKSLLVVFKCPLHVYAEPKSA